MSYESHYYWNNNRIKYRTLTEEDYRKICNGLSTLQNIMSEIDYCLMLRDNLYEFFEACENTEINDQKNFNMLNRRMMNWLNSFYAWIEYHERHYKTLFAGIKSKYHSNHFEYRFAYAMRRYTTHQTVCVSKLSFDLLAEKTTIQIPLDELLQNGQELNSTLRKELNELQEQSDFIDAVSFAKGFYSMFESMQKEIWESILADGHKVLLSIMEYMQSNRHIILESYITKDGSHVKTVGSFLFLYQQKIQQTAIPSHMMQYMAEDGSLLS